MIYVLNEYVSLGTLINGTLIELLVNLSDAGLVLIILGSIFVIWILVMESKPKHTIILVPFLSSSSSGNTAPGPSSSPDPNRTPGAGANWILAIPTAI